MRAPIRAGFSCAVSVLLASGVARAQDQSGGAVPAGASGAIITQPKSDDQPPPPKPPVVTMPAVKKNEGAAYPKQAIADGIHDTVEVALEITVDASGVVTRALVEKPVGHGFDEAAIAAAQALVFDPATRDGKPIAATIRFVYRFSPPPAALSGRVVTRAGERPIAGATVVVRDAKGGEHTATTDADGAWRIAGLEAGAFHVRVRAPGMAAHESDESVKPGEEASAVDRLEPEAPNGRAAEGPHDEVETVEVRGTKPPREVTKRTLEQREIDSIPGTGGDALRSLLNLPGVARPPGLAGILIVRGSAPQDTQYFVDGTNVPLIYHFGGLSSVVPTEMIDRIDFYPGNFSTQFGRAMGGIVDVGLRDPKQGLGTSSSGGGVGLKVAGDNKLHGLAQVDLIDTRLLVQGPIGSTGWNFAVGARRSWFDQWLGPVLEQAGAGVSVAPVYYDYQAMVGRDLGKRSSIRFAFFGSDDRFSVILHSASASEPELAGSIGSHSGFWRAQAIYKNRFSDDTELRIVAAVGEDYADFTLGDNYFHLTDWPIQSRVELSQKLQKTLTMNVGMDMFYDPYTVALRFPPLPKPGEPPGGPFLSRPPLETQDTDAIYRPALYTEFEATPWTGARIVPGIRLDYAKDARSWDLSPRFVVRQDVTGPSVGSADRRTTLKAGLGLFAQPPQPYETNPVFGMRGLTSNRAYHYDLGVEREFTRQIEASVEGFYKQLDHLVTQGYGNVGTGNIYGVETLVRYKPDERFFGWLAYTLSRSLRRDYPGAPLRLSVFDETHILTVLGSYRLGRGWQLGARYRLTSGYLWTPNGYGFYDENSGVYLPLRSYPPNTDRLPLFHSLDIRVDKWWQRPWGTIRAYLDVLNVYNEGNVAGISYDYNYVHTTYANDLPFLPSLGLRIEM